MNLIKKHFKKIIPAALVIILACWGCSKGTYHFLTPEDVAWMVYKQGDKIKFTNGPSFRTYDVIRLYRGYLENGSEHNEHIRAYISFLTDTSAGNSAGNILVEKTAGGTQVTFSFPHFLNEANVTSTAPETDTINGILYNDIYLLHSPTDAEHKISTIYYSKSAGFVKLLESGSSPWFLTN
jgi:hypothetical protein